MSAGYTLDMGKLSRGAERLEDAATGELFLWSLETGDNRLQLHGYTSGAWTPHAALCAGAHLGKKTVVVWDPKKGGKPLVTLPDHPGLIYSVLYTPDGERVITCWMSTAVGALARGEVHAKDASRTGTKVWHAKTGKLLLSLDRFRVVGLSQDGKRLVVVDDH